MLGRPALARATLFRVVTAAAAAASFARARFTMSDSSPSGSKRNRHIFPGHLLS